MSDGRTTAADSLARRMESPSDVATFIRALTRDGVRYALIRRDPRTPWTVDGDVDVLVDPADQARAEQILMRDGLVRVTRDVPDTGIFFRQVSPFGLVTLHVQDTVHYVGPELVICDGLAEMVLDSAVLVGDIRYADPAMNRYLVKGKIRFEGSPISAKYQDILGKDASTPDPRRLSRDFDAFLDELGIVPRSTTIARRWLASRWLRGTIRLATALFTNQHICITGVDGTGKSTLAQNLQRALSGRVRLQYMGEKEWQTRLARTAFQEGAGAAGGALYHMARRLIAPLALYLEMWYRFAAVSARSGVVVFDRYPDEFHVRRKGLARLAYWLLFRVLLPQPRLRFYLTCALDTSTARKDDLGHATAASKLVERKRQFDAYFGGRRGVVVLDTGRLGVEETLRSVLSSLPDTLVTRL